ncbi:MAG: MFS transporter [Chloroflexi bacterium]|nr:MFS transporter [Chloroflexota bacterium]
MWIAQALSQTAQNAVFYGLMVLVEKRTASTLYMGFLISSILLPFALFGVMAGVLVDRWNKKAVLVVTNLLRGAVAFGYIFVLNLSIFLLYPVNILFSAISQFFAPAELAAIPSLVPRRQLIVANGLFNLTLTGSQMAGFILFGPFLVKLIGVEALFFSISAVFVGCSLLVARLPSMRPGQAGLAEEDEAIQMIGGPEQDYVMAPNSYMDFYSEEEAYALPLVIEPMERLSHEAASRWDLGLMLAELKDGWAILRKDRQLSLAIFNLTVIGAVVMIMGMLLPGYVARVLGVHPEDAVFIFAPAGVGVILGIQWVSRLQVSMDKGLIVNLGLALLALGLLLLGLMGWWEVNMLRTAPVTGPNSYTMIFWVMMVAFIPGIAFAFVNVPAQTVVHERTPAVARGRILAIQLVFVSLASILPLMFLAGLAEVFGPSVALILVALLVLGAALYSYRRENQRGAAISPNPVADSRKRGEKER